MKEIDAKDLLAKFDMLYLHIEDAHRGADGHYSIWWCNDLRLDLKANFKAFDYSALRPLRRVGSGLGVNWEWNRERDSIDSLSLVQVSDCFRPEGDHDAHPALISEEFATLVDRAIDEGDKEEVGDFGLIATGSAVDELAIAMLNLIFLPDAFDLIASWLS